MLQNQKPLPLPGTGKKRRNGKTKKTINENTLHTNHKENSNTTNKYQWKKNQDNSTDIMDFKQNTHRNTAQAPLSQVDN
jgi:hypothetical protein